MRRHDIRCAILRSAALVLLLGAAARAQGEAPKSQDPAKPAATAPAGDADVKRRWAELEPQEREKLKAAYERWQKLPPEERELLKRRHQRFAQIRERTHEALTDDELAQLRDLRADELRGELNRIVREHLKARLERLPPETRRRVIEEKKSEPPAEREKRMHGILEEEIDRRIRARLRGMVEHRQISPQEVESFARQVKDSPRPERAELLRRFIVDHADAFEVPPEMRARLRDAPDPARALFELERRRRASQEKRPIGPLERMRQRREKGREPQQSQH